MEAKLNIYLRKFDLEKDLVLFHKVYSDPASMRYYGMHPYTVLSQSRKLIMNYIESESNGKSVHRVISDEITDDYLGEIGIFNINTVHRRANAYCILLPEYRKKGVSVEASKLFYNEIFNLWQINRIQAFVDRRNVSAMKSLEGIGFISEGMLSQYEFFDGEYVDMAVFALLKVHFYELYNKY